ncbi:MAG: hypothetical protein AAF645_19570 [Myxococcota bacterium]
MSASSRWLTLLAFAGAGVLDAGCALVPLEGVGQGRAPDPLPPRVSVAEVNIGALPTERQIAQYVCMRRVPAPANQLVCRAFGRPLQENDLRFAFDVELEFENPNSIPLPVVQALVAFSAFPGTAEQNLGALCLSFCENPSSCPQDAESACRSDDPQIRDAETFAAAAANFLVRAAIGEASLEDLRIQTVEPGATARLVMRLELQPFQMLQLIERVFTDALSGLEQGRIPEIAIPYSIEGSAWVRVENFGRFAVNFGPAEGTWDLIEQLR